MRAVRVVTVAFTIAVVTACGGDPDVSTVASAELQERVAEIRVLAESRQTDELVAEIDELSGMVERLRGEGEISAEAAEEIMASIAEVRQNVSSITTTTTTTTTTTPPDEDDDDDEGRGKGEGRGNGGNGEDRGDDDD